MIHEILRRNQTARNHLKRGPSVTVLNTANSGSCSVLGLDWVGTDDATGPGKVVTDFGEEQPSGDGEMKRGTKGQEQVLTGESGLI